jgi:hypothetical protein
MKDIPRTFPGHPLFEKPTTRLAMCNVLSAFAVRNEDIGYCQGSNFICGVLLLLMEEEQAFWMLDTIVNETLPEFYYGCVTVALRVVSVTARCEVAGPVFGVD